MAVWYVVKRLDTGEINGHNTWAYSPSTECTSCLDDVVVHRFERGPRIGQPHHLIVSVHGRDAADAHMMADGIFTDWLEREGMEPMTTVLAKTVSPYQLLATVQEAA